MRRYSAQRNKFEVLDMGVGGRGFDVHQGLQYFEAEEMDKYSLFMPGSTMRDTRGATIEVLGVFELCARFVSAIKIQPRLMLA